MDARLQLGILAQPDEFTCGPTCLHAVYNYYGDTYSLEEVIDATPRLENGGTLAVMLAGQALQRGYDAKIYTFNLQMFDPTWFDVPGTDLADKLRAQAKNKSGKRFHVATQAYLKYLDAGGRLGLQDLTPSLIRRYLKRGVPILTGLSSTYLYRTAREWGPNDDFDDVRGEPQGHFVVLCGYDKEDREVLVADPQDPNPVSDTQFYKVNMDRLICSILLGVLTYDANLLVLQPKDGDRSPSHASAHYR
ncbi:MAG: hypothetical protein AMXMBFR84_36750 [Candidatus Hydrogenedentota bacterium]